MKKKRLISFFLASVLALSCVHFTAIAADSNVQSVSNDDTLDMDKWGTVTVTSPEKTSDACPGDTDGKYLHVSNVGTYGAGLTILPGKTLTITSGKYYKISFYARKMDTVNETGDMKARFLLNGGNPDAIGNAANKGISGGSITLSSDWQEYWIVLHNPNKTIEKIDLIRHWNKPDVVPFDIDEFSIVEVKKDGSNWVPVTNGTDFNTDLSISVRGEAVLSDVTDAEFYSIGGSTTDNTTFAYGGTETLSAGVYELSGKFRLSVFDYSKIEYVANTANGSLSADNNCAKLSLTFNSDMMKTTDGSDALTVTNEWTTGKFTLEVTAATPASAISFALDGKQVLNFDDITLKKTASYSENFASVNGKPAILSNDKRDGDDDSSYMSFVGTNDSGREYIQAETVMPAGTYTVSFWARAGAAVNYPSGGDGKTTLRVLLNGVEHKPNGTRGMALSSDWKHYSFDVATTDAKNSLSFQLRRHWYDDDSGVAIYIDDISIVEKGTTTNLYTGAGNWDTASGANGAGEFVAIDSSTEFYRIGADGTNTNFKYIGNDTLEAGVYHVSGEYRVAEYDFNNPDGILLTASCGGNTFKTTSGEDGILVGSDWSKGTYFLELTEATAKSDIVFTLDGTLTLDFKDVVYEDATDEYFGEWLTGEGAKLQVVDDGTETYYVIAKPSAGNTSVKYNGEGILSSGKWHVSAKFRLSENTTANVSAKVGEKHLNAYLGASMTNSAMSFTVGDDGWATATFVINVTENDGIAKKLISFEFDKQISAQACEFKFERADALYSDLWVSGGDTPAINIADGRPGDTDGKYIHVSELNVYTPASGLAYYDTNHSFDPAKTYRLTFWMRTLPQVGADSVVSDANNMNVRVYVGDFGPGSQNGIEIVPKALSLDEGYFSNQAQLVGEWTKYSLTFNTQAKPTATSFRLSFYRFYNKDDALPFDIDGLSVVEIDPATGEALSSELVTKDYLAYQTFGVAKAEELTAVDYSRATAKAGTDTVLSSTAETVYPAGIYHINGSFRLTEFDPSKLVYNGSFVAENNISALLMAEVDGNDLKTTDGTDFKVTNEWQDVTFIYTASKEFAASDIAFALDGALALDFKNIEIIDANSLYLENWVAGDGSLVGVVHDVREGDADNTYIHVGGAMTTGAAYTDPSTNLVDGARYRLSFFARSTPFVNSPADDSGAGNVTIRTSINSSNIMGNVQKSSVNLTSEWKQYTFIFNQADLATGAYYKKDGLYLNIYRYWFEEDGAPYDLDGVVLVQIDENDNPVSENLLKPEIKWGSYSGAPVEEISLEEFYRISAPSVGVTSIECLDNIELEPGVYQIAGKFRLPTFDFNGSSADLSAYAGDAAMTTAAGHESAALSAEWNEITFVFNTMVPINMNTIRLTLNDAVDFDFYDLQITLVERHVSLSSVNTGVIVTLLLLKEKAIEAAGYVTTWKANNVALETVDAVLDEATGKVGAKDGANGNTFIRFANRDSNFDKLIYKNDNVTLKPGSYKVSFWARTAPYINAPAENNAVRLRMYNDAECISHISIRRSSQGSYYSHNAIQLNSIWTYYSFIYSVTKETPMVYYFNGTASGYGVAPIDIDGFSVIAVDSASNKPVTGENLAVDSNKLKGAGAAGWSTTGEGIGVYESVLETYVETEYLHANAVKGQNTEIRCASSRKLAPGTYYVTTKVRLATLDYAKYTFESGSNLSADDNKAVLTASLKGSALKTPEGADSVTVTSEWTDVIFVLDVNEEVSLRSLAITADSSVALDFDYINVDTKIKKDIAVDTSAVGEWQGTLPPLPAITEGNFLEGALEADNLAYWSYGPQTLTHKTDDEGNSYLAATNIKNNTLGFIYDPGYPLSPGLYKLSLDIRTINEGEKGILRMLVNDQYKLYSTGYTNEWTTVSMAFEVKEAQYLKVKLFGGLNALSIQDYEIKDLTLVDVVGELEGQNLVVGGSFDDETALENWTVQQEAKLTLHKDGYLQITDRAASICGGVLKVDLGFRIPAGTKFKVSYDIRASKPDTTFKIRSFIGNVGLDVEDFALAWRHYEYYITNEWEHVESSYVSVGDDYLKFIVQGGVDATDNGDIDLDNIVIEILR